MTKNGKTIEKANDQSSDLQNGKEKKGKRRRKEKKLSWSTRDGHIAPIFVPTTPGGILLKMMRKVAEEETKEGIGFKILEVGGKTIKRTLQKSNPTATPGCDEEDCLACYNGRGQGGDCRKNNVNYEIECKFARKVRDQFTSERHQETFIQERKNTKAAKPEKKKGRMRQHHLCGDTCNNNIKVPQASLGLE